MRVAFVYTGSLAWLVLICPLGQAQVEHGLASSYPQDLGIGNDPRVVFTEDFEEASIDELAARWENVSGQENMSFDGDRPAETGGAHSIFFDGGAHLYRCLTPGYDQIYLRFYTKFSPSCSNIHHFVHLGGYNPPSSWPQGTAGIRPTGADQWTTGIEPMGSNWAWDLYTYWMHMRTNPGGGFWGNVFCGKPSPFPAERGSWTCVEVMVKMNDPVSSRNGEQAFWIDGVRKSHLGPGFPRGEWIWDGFWPNDSCTPSGLCDPLGSGTPCCQDFEGFQWRSVTELNINFLWLLHYVDTDPTCAAWLDDVVVATEYIGPMVTGPFPDGGPDGDPGTDRADPDEPGAEDGDGGEGDGGPHPGDDGGAEQTEDASPQEDGDVVEGGESMDGNDETTVSGGCGCRTPGGDGLPFLLLLGLVLARAISARN